MKLSTSTSRFLRVDRITFVAGDGREVSIEAVTQDTKPTGSNIGTVVALHGAPGSHNDFKYVLPWAEARGLRLIGINFPGMGLTPEVPFLRYTNDERNNFVSSLLDVLQLNSGDVVFLGHSRGAENCLQLALMRGCRGVVLANPTGLRPHRSFPGLRLIRGFRRLYDYFTFMRGFWHWMFGYIYNNILGMRVPHGQAACVAYKSLEHLEFSAHGRHVDAWNEGFDGRCVVAYGGRDWMIEREISEEFVHSFRNLSFLEVKERDENAEIRAIEWLEQVLQRNSARNIAVCFDNDDHFLQKHKGRFLAEAAFRIFTSET